MAKKATFDASVSKDFLGNDIPTIEYVVEYEEPTTGDEARAADEFPRSDKECIAVVVAKRKAAARAKKQTEVLVKAGFIKPQANDETTLWNDIYSAMFAATKDKNLAATTATNGLGYTFEQAKEMVVAKRKAAQAEREALAEAEKANGVEVTA